MAEEINIFEFSGMKLRTLLEEGDPWFVAQDVCEVLGLTTGNAVRTLDDDETRSVYSIHAFNKNSGLRKNAVAINESGLYSLILRSRKPEARTFKKWVTGIVLPSIRKTGGYIQNEENINDPEELMARALIMAKNKIESLEQRNKDLTRLISVYAYLYNYQGLKPSHSLSIRVGRKASKVCRNRGISALEVKQGYQVNHYPIEILDDVVENMSRKTITSA